MDDDIVDSANKVSSILVIRILLRIRIQSIQKAYFAKNDGIFRLEDRLCNPAKYRSRLEKAARTGCDKGTSSRRWTVTHLLV